MLLEHAGVAFVVRPTEVDETPLGGERADEHVRRLADAKVRAVPLGDGEVGLGADTVVEVEGAILGKPLDADDARRMLRLLSARTHRVHTGLAARRADAVAVEHCVTEVDMRSLTDHEIAAYVGSGEPADKAGAYAIQGRASLFVTSVRGSYPNVVGLPVHLVPRLLARVGVDLADLGAPDDAPVSE
jgi:septum formation protein